MTIAAPGSDGLLSGGPTTGTPGAADAPETGATPASSATVSAGSTAAVGGTESVGSTPSAGAEPAADGARRGWRWWLYTGLVAAGALWLAFTVAHLVLSGRWWLWLAVDAVPPPAFLGVPLLLAGAAAPCRRSRRPVALLAAAALLLGGPLSGLNLRGLSGGDGPAPADAVRVFGWNTGYWDEGGQTAGMYALLRAADADVYLLQEYWYEHSAGPGEAELARLRAEFPGFHVAVAGELVTLSRHPILRRLPLDAPDMPPPLWGTTEQWRYKVLRTDLDLGAGRVLSVYNLHMPVQLVPDHSPLGGEFYRVIRQQHAQREPQWRALARDVAVNPHPMLLAGDLNTSPAMGDLTKLPDRLRDASYASSARYPATWSDGSGWPRWWRLDWAFVSAAVRVHSYRFGGSTNGASDHRAQQLVISLR
ncbi:endonuclease/exonuclease/phosphatase family protein [Plantactinospora sp. KLBMP9567]|uniref:endonuclease/exonuclease/phosphatase family protein n=1 Tax=Plantactinospora sp. KLBMP9567 TaxID=3085900 RepID=UPI0029823FCC|nr:endonuclease/exonuclease/phosphatase family protein [Plantactinospora sp. KLBMP9567]MDW5325323.1 endonuclease/exonuclease/phosphatase family protein [Plantactinospora sp. KLBMP9567]